LKNSVIFVANNQSAVVEQPGKQALDFPAPHAPTKRAIVLRRRPQTRSMECDHFVAPWRPHIRLPGLGACSRCFSKVSNLALDSFQITRADNALAEAIRLAEEEILSLRQGRHGNCLGTCRPTYRLIGQEFLPKIKSV
jgi:hypothetical protein